MGYSTTTPNLGLPQFGMNDKPTWQDLNSAFLLIDTVVGSIAPKYDESQAYAVGDFVQHEGGLYKCKEVTTGTWDGTKWDATLVSDNLESTSMTGFVKVDLVNGTGITSNEYSHLMINS